MVIDEYSRFPFVFPCPNMHTSTVVKCLDQLFFLCEMPSYVHSDNVKSFISKELKDFLTKRGVDSSKSSPYHPTANSQKERYNVSMEGHSFSVKVPKSSDFILGECATRCTSFCAIVVEHKYQLHSTRKIF